MDPHQQWLPAENPRRRRLLLAAAARTALTTVVLTTLYFVLPLHGPNRIGLWAELAGGFVVVIALIAWQVRRVVAARYPGLRAVEALALTAVVFILLYATIYYELSVTAPDSFTALLTRVDALYFTVTVLGTVGFGDLAATTQVARILVTVQILADLVLLGAGVRLLVAAAHRGRARSASST
ncbi:potassium channel family protein [Nocardia veterana]|uniref:Two pore domain potassium channel family protein n=1 Tax=Nocardia veterana TaxID=132249 RepID=A0A7X6RHX8_9NOCA|nr:potassium channel family protein [Nocardia veterana]NKY86510.1 two pore domain potassium channel family protein [Nocardia veterana]